MNFIRHGLRNLANFRGRESRSQFWRWAGLVLLLMFLGLGVMMGVQVGRMFSQLEGYAAEHPEAVTVHRAPGHVAYQVQSPGLELLPDLASMFVGRGVGLAMAVGLLAAAVARRLHDAGVSGLWGLPPLPFLAGGLILFSRMWAAMQRPEEFPTGLFLAGFLNNLLYLATLALLIILLIRPSAAGANRFGEPPAV
jgi:uncharacterized membrane protein YhaH (DUF805 family)